MTSLLSTGTTGRPEPVLDAAKVAAAVSGTVLAIGAVFVLVGWATADEVQNWAVIAGGIVTSIGALIAVVLPIITAYGARAQVTPLAAPVSVEGAPLVAAAGVPAPAPFEDRRDITDALRDLPASPASSWPATSPISAVGAWTPPTPAAMAAEPTPIEAEVAASTGRIPPVSTPSV